MPSEVDYTDFESDENCILPEFPIEQCEENNDYVENIQEGEDNQMQNEGVFESESVSEHDNVDINVNERDYPVEDEEGNEE